MLEKERTMKNEMNYNEQVFSSKIQGKIKLTTVWSDISLIKFPFSSMESHHINIKDLQALIAAKDSYIKELEQNKIECEHFRVREPFISLFLSLSPIFSSN